MFKTKLWSKTQFPIADKSNSPTHRTISISDIRLARVATNGSSSSGGSGGGVGGGGSGGDSSSGTGGNDNTNDSTQRTSPMAQQTQVAVVAAAAASSVAGSNSQLNTGNGTNLNSTSAIITIKQEQLATVDNLVGSFVDSTTFLHSPSNSQMVNPNLVQNSGLSGLAGEFTKKKFLKH